jgi:hypothetical protein
MKAFAETVEQWGVFELALTASTDQDDGNPFVDTWLRARFRNKEHDPVSAGNEVAVSGFYDGEGIYRVRFIPALLGEWTFSTQSNRPELDGIEGSFTATAPSSDNHGVVRVHNTYHFRYEDGTDYYPFGTTCYAWVHQTESLQEQTLHTLQTAKFNKLRMCIFPKFYPYNESEPPLYPFERNAAGESDFSRFNPAFFRHLENRIVQLGELGIEADLILWHPYDRWGYSTMDEETDYRYLRYVIARLSAYRNVWWSLANEYDFLLTVKPIERWDRFFEILRDEDPYQHLRSIHNGDVHMNYDHTKDVVSHVCIQNWDVKRVREWLDTYQKPVINDECEYEGNIPFHWGNLSPQELVHRFWIMVANGAYAGHGETYEHAENLLWWSHGGMLHGESWQRIAFLKQIIEEAPAGGLLPLGTSRTNDLFHRISAGANGDYRLLYLGEHQPSFWSAGLPESNVDDFEIDIIDTWNMTILSAALRPVRQFAAIPAGAQKGYELVLPGKPYLAVRIRPRAS